MTDVYILCMHEYMYAGLEKALKIRHNDLSRHSDTYV